ncbi:hypothetical protein [Enterocloster lavalensis]|nr:hypothetical protein [Enterocloster lavalensis]
MELEVGGGPGTGVGREMAWAGKWLGPANGVGRETACARNRKNQEIKG